MKRGGKHREVYLQSSIEFPSTTTAEGIETEIVSEHWSLGGISLEAEVGGEASKN